MSNILNKEDILDILNSNEIKKLLSKYNIKSLIRFGSINTDEFYEYSDVDLAVISDIKLSFDDLITLEFTLQGLLNREIDIIDLNSNNLDLFIKINILNTGVLIHTFDNNFTLEQYTDFRRKFKDKFGKEKIELLDLFYGYKCKALTIPEIAEMYGEDYIKMHDKISNARESAIFTY